MPLICCDTVFAHVTRTANAKVNHSDSNVLKFTRAVGVQMLEEHGNHSEHAELCMCEVVKKKNNTSE